MTDTQRKVLAHALRIHRVYLGEMLAKAKTDKLKEYWGEQVKALDQILAESEGEITDADQQPAVGRDDDEIHPERGVLLPETVTG